MFKKLNAIREWVLIKLGVPGSYENVLALGRTPESNQTIPNDYLFGWSYALDGQEVEVLITAGALRRCFNARGHYAQLKASIFSNTARIEAVALRRYRENQNAAIVLHTRDFYGERTRWLLSVIKPIRPKA